MKHKPENKYLAWGLTAFLVISASLLFTYLVFNSSNVIKGLSTLRRILMPIIDGLALAYILTPLLNFVENKWICTIFKKLKIRDSEKSRRHRRSLSILTSMILVFGIVYLFFRIVIPQLILSVQSIILQLPVYINNLEIFFYGLLENNPELESTANHIFEKYILL